MWFGAMLVDMLAFFFILFFPCQAANPGAVLEDFVRWYSPKDWLPADHASADAAGAPHAHAHVHGRLSTRMGDPGGDNLWRRSWRGAVSQPARLQAPLFDPTTEAEKVLHFLEAVTPAQVLSQVRVAFALADGVSVWLCGCVRVCVSVCAVLFMWW